MSNILNYSRKTSTRYYFAAMLAILFLACAGCQGSKASTGGGSNLFSSSKRTQAEETELRELLAAAENAMVARQHHEARGYYLKVMDIYEKNPKIQRSNVPYCQMGIISEEMKMYDEAEAYFAQAISMDPEQAEPYNCMGYCLLRQEKYADAIQWLEKAVQREPANPKYLNNLALACGGNNDYQNAFRNFRLAGSEADAYYNMSTIFAMHGKDQEAKEVLQKALHLNPNHKNANRMIAMYSRPQFDADDNSNDLYDNHRNRLVDYREGDQLANNPEPVTAGYHRQYGSSHQAALNPPGE